MFTAAFWKAAAERAIKTFAQTLAALLVVDGADLLSIDWPQSLSVSALATIISVLTSVASASAGNPGPSLTTETTRPHTSGHRTPPRRDLGHGTLETVIAVVVLVLLVLILVRLLG